MADERTARPVSGEIMSGPPRASGGREPAVDVLDADYVVLKGDTASAAASPAAQATDPPLGTAPAGKAPDLAGMAMLKGPQETVARFGSRGGPFFWTAGLGLVAAAFWVSGGHALVRQGQLFPTPAPALRISQLDSRVDASGSRPLLFVDGEVANDGNAAAPVPTMEIVVTDMSGQTMRYRLGTSARTLRPGEEFAFSSRLDVPKNGVKSVTVGFAE